MTGPFGRVGGADCSHGGRKHDRQGGEGPGRGLARSGVARCGIHGCSNPGGGLRRDAADQRGDDLGVAEAGVAGALADDPDGRRLGEHSDAVWVAEVCIPTAFGSAKSDRCRSLIKQNPEDPL